MSVAFISSLLGRKGSGCALDYEHSRLLDVHVWSAYPQVNTFVDFIYEQYFERNNFQGRTKLSKNNLKVVLLDLYVAWLSDPDLLISVSRDNNSFKAGSRYNELSIGKAVLKVVDHLSSVGLIYIKDGFYNRSTGIGRQSRIWPTHKLIKMFKQAKFGVLSVTNHSDRESIVLRNESKENIEYDDTDETNRMRAVLKSYNALLTETHIDLRFLDGRYLETGDQGKTNRVFINQNDKFVRRVFNNSSWQKGGRFYGGWWQRCPKDYRHEIVLDGFVTQEVDYSGIHVVLMYALEGIDYWKDFVDDPYNVERPEIINEAIDFRKLCKTLFLISINSTDEKSCFQAFRSEAESGSLEKRLTDDKLGAVLSALCTKHDPIKHKIASGAALDLMYQDSKITAEIIKYFTGEGVPILTIHDSYIVPFGYDKILMRKMKEAFAKVAGVKNVRLEHTTIESDAFFRADYWSDDERAQAGKDLGVTSQRHLNELKLFNELYQKPDREDWVPDWTAVY
jgi:hypothetical protein